MAEPRPVRTLFLFEGLGLVALACWWATLAPGVRYAHLLAVRDLEHVTTLPPSEVLAQAQWLVEHRGQALRSLAVLGAVTLLMGMVEGMARRSRDPWGGFRMSWWVGGTVSAGLVVALTSVYLVLPFAVKLTHVAGGLGVLVAVSGYALGLGRPYAK